MATCLPPASEEDCKQCQCGKCKGDYCDTSCINVVKHTHEHCVEVEVTVGAEINVEVKGEDGHSGGSHAERTSTATARVCKACNKHHPEDARKSAHDEAYKKAYAEALETSMKEATD